MKIFSYWRHFVIFSLFYLFFLLIFYYLYRLDFCNSFFGDCDYLFPIKEDMSYKGFVFYLKNRFFKFFIFYLISLSVIYFWVTVPYLHKFTFLKDFAFNLQNVKFNTSVISHNEDSTSENKPDEKYHTVGCGMFVKESDYPTSYNSKGEEVIHTSIGTMTKKNGNNYFTWD